MENKLYRVYRGRRDTVNGGMVNTYLQYFEKLDVAKREMKRKDKWECDGIQLESLKNGKWTRHETFE